MLKGCFDNVVNVELFGKDFRSVRKLFIGRSFPAYFCSDGFGSNVSTCEGPPLRKIWITRLALGAKCDCLTESVDDTAAQAALGSIDPRAKPPMPIPQRERNSRRVKK